MRTASHDPVRNKAGSKMLRVSPNPWVSSSESQSFEDIRSCREPQGKPSQLVLPGARCQELAEAGIFPTRLRATITQRGEQLTLVWARAVLSLS